MRQYNKAQAATEFIITYGWAILAVLIVISGLTYFGFFNTQKYQKEDCTFGDRFRCEDFAAYDNGTLALQLRNNFQYPVNITAIKVSSIHGITTTTINQIIIPGNITSVLANITNQLVINDLEDATVTITFKRAGGDNPLHNTTGNVLVKVTAAPVAPAGPPA